MTHDRFGDRTRVPLPLSAPARIRKGAPPQAAVPIVVGELTAETADLWHLHVQPAIRSGPKQADQGWDWRKIRASKYLDPVPGPLHRAVVNYAAYVPVGDLDVPCGLIQVVENYPTLVRDAEPQVFVWYFSVAPRGALQALAPQLRVQPRIGQILIDIAVTHSFWTGCEGRVLLHAAPRGGDRLLEFYRDLTMLSVPLGLRRPFIKFPLRINDGRYFYFDAARARTFSVSNDQYRPP